MEVRKSQTIDISINIETLERLKQINKCDDIFTRDENLNFLLSFPEFEKYKFLLDSNPKSLKKQNEKIVSMKMKKIDISINIETLERLKQINKCDDIFTRDENLNFLLSFPEFEKYKFLLDPFKSEKFKKTERKNQAN